MSKINECIAIYREAFGVEEDFEKELFKNCFKYCKTIEADGKTVSMLFSLPCEIVFKNKFLPASYIFAVATKTEERGKGYMSELLNILKNETNSLLFLRPANEDLIKLYGSLGFKAIPAKSVENGFPFVKPLADFTKLAKEYKTPDGSDFAVMYYGKYELKNLNFIYSME